MIRKEEKDNELQGKQGNSHDLPSPIILSGTQFATGEGWFVCVVVGDDSCVGKILKSLQSKIETTPL